MPETEAPKQDQKLIGFAGKHISISSVSRMSGVERTKIGRILRGQAGADVHDCKKIAAAMGLSLDEFVIALDLHIEQANFKYRKARSIFDRRINKQTREKLAAQRAGKPYAPPMPVSKSV